MSDPDLQLLARYARHRAEDAFAEIVRRHLDLVFSAALRQVRSPHLAEEVAQSVFTDLARRAAELAPDTTLAAWLYQVTRRTAIDVVRRESRRQLREQIACDLNAMNASAPDWTRIEPLLDEAMAALDEADRTALLLRYFKNQSLREVGQTLGITDDAAQKRVSRAVERLRDYFARHGVSVGVGGLVVILSANAIQAAPAGLALAISTAALAGAAVSTTGTLIVAKTLALTTVKATVIAATLAVVAGPGIYQTYQATTLRHQAESLRQQLEPAKEQWRQWQSEQDEVSRRLAALASENEQMQSAPNEAELVRLRGEIARLKAAEKQKSEDPIRSAAEAWLDRVRQLKDYLEQHPDQKIPELDFLSLQGWLGAVDPSMAFLKGNDFYDHASQMVRMNAENGFGTFIQVALGKYADANNGTFPTDLSQLQPYCDPKVEAVLQELYVIKPARILPADQIKELRLTSEWVVTRRQRVVPNSTSRSAFFANGCASWQSPPGRDD